MNILKILNIKFKEEDTVQQIRTRLLFLILFLINVLGIPALVIAAIEAYSLKQYATILVYLSFFVPIVIVTIFRKQLKYTLIVYVFISSAFLLAAGNIVTYGFSGAGIPIFFGLFALTTLFLNQKAGLFMVLFSAISVCVIGYLYITHTISLDISLNEISTKLISWITALSVLVLLGAIIVFSYGIIHTKMLESIELAQKKAKDLNEANIKLSKDIQERIKTEQELKESEGRFGSIIEQIGDTMFISDFEGNIHTVNKKACEDLGYTREELVKLNISEIDSNPIDKMEFKEQWKDLIAGEVHTLETRHKRKNGKTFPVEVSFGLYNYSNKKSILGFARDISHRENTEREIKSLNKELEKRVEERTVELENKSNELENTKLALLNIVEDLNEKSEQLEQSTKNLQNTNKELEAFSYSISHDLRAPLRAIDGFTQILTEDYISKLDDEGKRIGAIIQQNSKKMGNLIDDLLAFSRLGRSALNYSKINMKYMANAIYYELTSNENRQHITINIEDIPPAYADTNMMRQVWINILSNSMKYSSKRDNSIISINFKEETDKYIYCVKDNGVGFNMKYKEKLFGVFQRLHSDKEFEGTGVGLALVQRIIHRHNGEIWANAEIDKGAEFYFSIPKNTKIYKNEQ
jgi:PAS domain S-box-containing protein